MSSSPSIISLAVAGVAALTVLGILLVVLRRYQRCPPNAVLIIFGKVGREEMIVVSSGGRFVWPVIQDHRLLSLEPIVVETDIRSALSKNNIRVNVPSSVTVGISTDPEVLSRAARRLLSLDEAGIAAQARDIILGQMRLVIAQMTIDEINEDHGLFLDSCFREIETELTKIGLKVININVRDLTDESGYIEAIGRKAAAVAINEAKTEVAEIEREAAHARKLRASGVEPGFKGAVTRKVPNVIGGMGQGEIVVDGEPQLFDAISLGSSIYESDDVVVVERRQVMIVKKE